MGGGGGGGLKNGDTNPKKLKFFYKLFLKNKEPDPGADPKLSENSDPDPGKDQKKIIPDPQHCLPPYAGTPLLTTLHPPELPTFHWTLLSYADLDSATMHLYWSTMHPTELSCI